MIRLTGGGDYLDYSGNTALGTLTQYTVLSWFQHTDAPVNLAVCEDLLGRWADNFSASYWRCLTAKTSTTSNLIYFRRYSTTTGQWTAFGQTLTPGQKYFTAFVIDLTVPLTPTIRMWLGDEQTLAVEVTVTTQIPPVGTLNAETGTTLEASGENGTYGTGASGIVNSLLTEPQIRDWQSNPRNIPGMIFLQMPGYNGLTTFPDYSGNGGTGVLEPTGGPYEIDPDQSSHSRAVFPQRMSVCA